MKPNFTLDGKIALVTGSSQGLGYGMAAGLAGAGATVVLNGRREDVLEQARRELVQTGASVHTATFDVTDRVAVEEAVARIESEVGPIDILINNAGGGQRMPFAEMTAEAWSRIIDLNLNALFIVSQAVAVHMIPRGRGKIINTCSLMSSIARKDNINYAASKGGAAMFTKALAVELGPHNIQVNGIAPGYMSTPFTQVLKDDTDFNAWITGHTPLRRWGEIADLAGPAVFLASDASGYVSGQVLYVDGGFSASM